MPSLDDVVSVSITRETRVPSQVGFGTPLLLGYSSLLTAGTVYTYTDLAAMEDDGFNDSHSLYKMARSLLAQDPGVEQFKVGTIATAYTQSLEITITSATEGNHVKLTLVSPAGVETAIDYTILAAETTTTVATAVELLVEAVTGMNSTSALAVVTATPASAGELWGFHSLTNCTIVDKTVSTIYDTALGNLSEDDNDWYAVAIDLSSSSVIQDVAIWVEANKKIFVGQMQGVAAYTSLCTTLEGLEYDRTATILAEDQLEYPACAWIGRVLPKSPGSTTWKFKQLSGVTKSNLTSSQETAILADQGNFYSDLASVGMTFNGTMASGEFIDVMQGVDWLTARLKERLFGILINADKVPYTDASVDRFISEIRAQLQSGVDVGFLAEGTLVVTGPKVADVSAVDRAARLLPDLKFSARLAGAVHKVSISGTVSV